MTKTSNAAKTLTTLNAKIDNVERRLSSLCAKRAGIVAVPGHWAWCAACGRELVHLVGDAPTCKCGHRRGEEVRAA